MSGTETSIGRRLIALGRDQQRTTAILSWLWQFFLAQGSNTPGFLGRRAVASINSEPIVSRDLGEATIAAVLVVGRKRVDARVVQHEKPVRFVLSLRESNLCWCVPYLC